MSDSLCLSTSPESWGLFVPGCELALIWGFQLPCQPCRTLDAKFGCIDSERLHVQPEFVNHFELEASSNHETRTPELRIECSTYLYVCVVVCGFIQRIVAAHKSPYRGE
eukprot:1868607-Pyramimonas_sp.AAC.1